MRTNADNYSEAAMVKCALPFLLVALSSPFQMLQQAPTPGAPGIVFSGGVVLSADTPARRMTGAALYTNAVTQWERTSSTTVQGPNSLFHPFHFPLLPGAMEVTVGLLPADVDAIAAVSGLGQPGS